MGRVTVMTRVAEAGEATAWLRTAEEEGAVGGYDPSGWEATIWVLHSMYENPALEQLGTHDDLIRAERAAAKARRERFDDLMSDPVGRATGVPADCEGDPGPPWQRLRWVDLAARRGKTLATSADWHPHTDWLHRRWPVSVIPPPEGSLDLDDLDQLLNVLADHSPNGWSATYYAYYCELTSQDLATPTLWTGPLSAVAELTRQQPQQYSPSNFWPHDRSLFVWTDFDLCGTKVSGSKGLIDDLGVHPRLETIEVPVE